MRIDVLTLFPQMFESPLGYSILKRAQEKGIVDIVLTDIRDFATNQYKKVDDKPDEPACLPCADCHNKGYKLTDEGRTLKEFIKRWL